MLSGLEQVNLIKNGDFEYNYDVWIVETGAMGYPNPAVGSSNDSSNSVSGLFSASGDTRERPSWSDGGLYDSVAIRQEFLSLKRVSDIDSLIIHQLVELMGEGAFLSTDMSIVGFTYADPERNGFGYGLLNPQGISVDNWLDISRNINDDDTIWRSYHKSIQIDFVEGGLLQPNQEIASFVLVNWGAWFSNTWHGQKLFWDDVRLMGYADYDVGVKEITSPGGHIDFPYVPEARIKNFGRQPTDSFLAIATIKAAHGEGCGDTIYTDTLVLSLPPDTEDTFRFKDFNGISYQHMPPLVSCTLHVRTVMEPDESDADDVLKKDFIYGAIAEPVTHPVTHLQLIVDPLTTSDVQVSFSVPQEHEGTLTLFDASGRRVDSKQVRGYGSAEFNSELTAGVFIVKLDASNLILTRKVVVVR